MIKENIRGIYIIENKVNLKCYVGQGKNVCERINSHFSGHGNRDIYFDFLKGNDFSVRIITLRHSRFKTINRLEKIAIAVCNSFYSGYNQTRGNRG